MNSRGALARRGILLFLLIFLALPVASTALHSLSAQWGATVLPRALTLSWYRDLWTDPRFLAAFGRSLGLCALSLGICCVITVPGVFVVRWRFPRWDGLVGLMTLLPFAVPPVVSSVGLLQIYSQGPLPLVGTPWILVGTYVTLALPFVYRAVSNSLEALDLKELLEAAHLLGASTPRAFLRVVLPNLSKGIWVSLLVSFSFLMGEFVFANLLVGTRFETLQVYLFNRRGVSGHFTSAIVMSYFAFAMLLSRASGRVGRLGEAMKEAGKEEIPCPVSRYGTCRNTSAPQGS